MPSLWLCLRPSPASGALTSHALLVQTSRERMTSVGCRHPHRICVLFTRIFGRCLCHSDPTNSQAILQVHHAGRRRQYGFDLCVPLCVRACAPGGGLPSTSGFYELCCYSAAGSAAEYRDDRVCVSVCPRASISPELHVQSLPNCLCVLLPTAADRSSSGGDAIRCVLPVYGRRHTCA